jgi:lipopolysaccharide export system protein LptA
MKRSFLTFAFAAAALTVSAQALAQISPQSGVVTLTAGTQRIDNNAHTLAYDGAVEILQDASRLRCDHALVTQASSGSGITSIEATGNVYYVTKTADGQQSVVRGDRAVYENSSDTIVITGGQVILVQGQNVMTGTRLVVQVSKGTTTFDTPAANDSGRVRGIFYPTKNK